MIPTLVVSRTLCDGNAKSGLKEIKIIIINTLSYMISTHCDGFSFKLEAQGWKPVINKHLKDHQLCFMLYADEKQKHFCVELIWSQFYNF